MDDNILIEAVRSKSEIYNKGHGGFKNPSIKESAWKAVAEAVNVPVADCISRWNTLRERYSKEKRYMETECRSGSKAPSRPIWIHYSSMSFLEPFVRKRKSISNLSVLTESEDPLTMNTQSTIITKSTIDDAMFSPIPEYVEEVVEPYEVLASCPASTSIASTSGAAPSLPYFGPSGRCKKLKVDKTAELFQEALSNLNKSMNNPEVSQTKVNHFDPDTLTGYSVTVALKNLQDNKIRIFFRKKFRELIQKCEEAELETSD